MKMPRSTAAWLASLRIARRDVRRARGRSLLVVVMVGLPVLATTLLTSLLATTSVTPLEAVPASMGTSQATILPQGRAAVDQSPDAQNYQPRGEDDTPTTPWRSGEVQRLTGGHVVAVLLGNTTATRDGRQYSLPLREIDLRDSATKGMVDLVSGRVPAKAGEVTVSPSMARGGIDVGDRLSLDKGTLETTVVGVARPRFGDDSPYLNAFPGTTLTGDTAQTTYLIQRSRPIGWSEVRRLNDEGLVVTSRAVLQDPPPASAVPASVQGFDGGVSAEQAGVLTIAIVAIVIEVVLLAGPAFAVGVSRQRRQLALVAAVGGGTRDVRRVVLAQGVVLGAGSAALGVVLGLVLTWLASGPMRRFGAAVGPYDVVPWQVFAAFALGAVAAVAAAWFPALQASRQDVVAVLAGRRGTTRTRAGWPVLGAVLVVLGTLGAVGSAARPGGETAAAFATVVVVIGAIALMPALLGLVGRMAGGLPLPLRLAARDASRSRGRTAPAIAAVMGAVAGITALALGSSSDFAQARRDYQPQYPMGTTVISSGYDVDDAEWKALGATTPTLLDGRHLLTYASVADITDAEGNVTSTVPSSLSIAAPGCSTPAVGQVSESTDPSCDVINSYNQSTLVASAAAIRTLGTPLTAAQEAALDEGKVLVADPRLLGADGRLHLVATGYDYDTGKATVVRRMPPIDAVALRSAAAKTPEATESSGGVLPGAALYLSAGTGTRLQLPIVRSGGVLERGAGPLTKDDEARLKAVVPGPDSDSAVYTERGFQETYTVQLAVLGGMGFLTVLIGTLTAVGLALSDSRPDLATLAAIGARPRTRRTMAAAQALLIGLLGALSGVLVGFVPGWAVSRPLTSFNGAGAIFDVPWTLLGGIGLGVPLLAALTALLLVRSQLPLTRRIG